MSGLAADAASLDPDSLESFLDRFSAFEAELRTHSEVEDGIMFPAIRTRGGVIDRSLTDDHHREQELVYDVACTLLEAKSLGVDARRKAVAQLLVKLRDDLLSHLAAEEDHVLSQVPKLIDDAEQADLLRMIIKSVPADPRLQPWVAAALTPEHREARLRNMAASLQHDVLVTVMNQIHAGVAASVWSDLEARTPELASLVDGRA